MKHAKLLAVFLAFMLFFTFTACKKHTDDSSAESAFKVGIICKDAPVGDEGYACYHKEGILSMCENLGLSDDQVVHKMNIDGADEASARTAIEACIREGCAIIFGTEADYKAIMEDMAKQYPDIFFSQYLGNVSHIPNMSTYAARTYEAEYLTGIAAGLKTASGKIGYVATMGKEDTLVKLDINAFAIGVKSVNPNAKVYIRVVVPERKQEAKEDLLALGCDVFGQRGGDVLDTSGASLVSPVFNWGVYYMKATREVMEGRWSGENYFGGMSDGVVALSPVSEACAEGTKEAIEAAGAKLQGGEYKIFEGKQIVSGALKDVALLDNNGNTIASAGSAAWDDASIRSGVSWYFENVIE